MTGLLSIIIPVFNEADNLKAVYDRVVAVVSSLDADYEILFIDDGSTDSSLDIIKAIHKRDSSHVRYFMLSRNFGHEAATTCGFNHCRGQAAVLLDADLQDPPEIIPQMFHKWNEGYEIVAGRRSERPGESNIKKLTSFIFYRIFGRFSDVKVPNDVGDFRLVDRKVIDHFNRLGERNRFVRGLFPWIGYRHTILNYTREPRFSGISKYNYTRLFWLSLDAISSFSVAPLRIALLIGIVVSVASLIAGTAVVIHKLFFGLELPGYALLAAGMFFLGGVQILFLGLIGEYVGKIYREVQNRPIFIVKESSDDNARSPQ